MFKKRTVSLALATVMLLPVGSAFAEENNQNLQSPPSSPIKISETLGWSEEEGLQQKPAGIVQFASGPNHSGWTEYLNSNARRAIGETTWAGTYHYTRAQLKNVFGTVKQDSNRKWGTGYSKAWTAYDDPGYSARTYYGN